MAAIKQRYNKWEAKVRVPIEHRDGMGGKEYRYRTLQATDRKGARLEAEAWKVGLRAEPASLSAKRCVICAAAGWLRGVDPASVPADPYEAARWTGGERRVDMGDLRYRWEALEAWRRSLPQSRV